MNKEIIEHKYCKVYVRELEKPLNINNIDFIFSSYDTVYIYTFNNRRYDMSRELFGKLTGIYCDFSYGVEIRASTDLYYIEFYYKSKGNK